MERRLTVHAGAYRQALIVALTVASSSALAAPKRADARAQFDRGVAAYTKGDYAAAAEALGTSYALDRVQLLSPLGAPCNPPPWGTLTAVRLATGEVAWEVPLGTTRDMAPFPVWLLLGTLGVPNQRGAIKVIDGGKRSEKTWQRQTP